MFQAELDAVRMNAEYGYKKNQRKDNVIGLNFRIKTNFQTKNFLHHLFPFLRIESDKTWQRSGVAR